MFLVLIDYVLALYVYIFMSYILAFQLTEAVLEPFYCQRLLIYATGAWLAIMLFFRLIKYKFIDHRDRKSRIKGLLIFAVVSSLASCAISFAGFGHECSKAWLECSQGNCKRSSEFH